MRRGTIEDALLMLMTGAALASIPLSGIAQEAPTSAIRQMIEMQLNSRATEPASPGVPGLEAGQLVLPPPVRATPGSRLGGATGPAPAMPTPGRMTP